MYLLNVMWFENRPLRRLNYAQRVAAPPLPAAWVVVFVRRSIAFPSDRQTLWLAGFYVLVCVWYGSLRELTARRISAISRHPHTFNWWRDALLRCMNTVSDAAAACCFLYFLVFDEPSYFPLLFIVSVATHCVVELEMGHRLSCIHSDHAYLGGRRPNSEEMHALDRLGELDEVTVVRHPV